MFLMILMAKLRKVEQKTKEICEKEQNRYFDSALFKLLLL